MVHTDVFKNVEHNNEEEQEDEPESQFINLVPSAADFRKPRTVKAKHMTEAIFGLNPSAKVRSINVKNIIGECNQTNKDWRLASNVADRKQLASLVQNHGSVYVDISGHTNTICSH